MSKSIRLSEEAYERLAAHKREDETFSEVVLRLAGERSLLEIAGVLDDEAAADLRDAVAERRERRAEALEGVAGAMAGDELAPGADGATGEDDGESTTEDGDRDGGSTGAPNGA